MFPLLTQESSLDGKTEVHSNRVLGKVNKIFTLGPVEDGKKMFCRTANEKKTEQSGKIEVGKWKSARERKERGMLSKHRGGKNE